jgi:hypothetical protein
MSATVFAVIPGVRALGQTPQYRIIVIEPPDGVTTVDVMTPDPFMGLNDRGEVVSSLHSDTADIPFVWLPTANPNYAISTPGTHVLPTQPDTRSFLPREINVNGIAVGRVYSQTYGTSAYYWNLNTGDHDILFLFDFDEHKDQATDINDAVPPVITGEAFVGPESNQRAYRKVFGGAAVDLDYFLNVDEFDIGLSISDAGLVAGMAGGSLSVPCGAAQNEFRAATWAAGTTTPSNLATLGITSAETFTRPIDVNNASPSMIVGAGDDPNDIVDPCRKRALFWSDPSSIPIALPFLIVNGQPASNDTMEAHAVADPTSDGIVRVVGFSEGEFAAVLCRWVNNVWEAIDLNTVLSCGGEQWGNLSHAYDINDCGWIVGHGTLTDGSPRAFILVPVSSCPGDIGGGAVQYPNGKVDIDDLLTVIGAWGTSNCVADINADAMVNIDDLLAVINNWGPCACWPSQPPVESFSQTLADADLTMSEWNAFADKMAYGSETEKENYNCWMQRYLSKCERCPACPGRDPFSE